MNNHFTPPLLRRKDIIMFLSRAVMIRPLPENVLVLTVVSLQCHHSSSDTLNLPNLRSEFAMEQKSNKSPFLNLENHGRFSVLCAPWNLCQI